MCDYYHTYFSANFVSDLFEFKAKHEEICYDLYGEFKNLKTSIVISCFAATTGTCKIDNDDRQNGVRAATAGDDTILKQDIHT